LSIIEHINPRNPQESPIDSTGTTPPARSERWRRAHGLGPRKPAQRPWLAEGISRSPLWYRRRAKARQQAAAAVAATVQEAVFDRLVLAIARLRRDLDRSARFTDEGAAIIAALAAMASGVGCRYGSNPGYWKNC
jgi:hypothetical protein